jgi:NADP-dependent 3-hydroxy acid dehydrogenase YdfG
MNTSIEARVVAMKLVSSELGQATACLFSAQGASGMLGARRAGRIKLLAGEQKLAHTEAV